MIYVRSINHIISDTSSKTNCALFRRIRIYLFWVLSISLSDIKANRKVESKNNFITITGHVVELTVFVC